MIKNLHFYLSDSFNPYINLAKEKVLFDLVGKEDLILYLWQNQNTVVIGKNQNAYSECRIELLKEEGGSLARRLSGGGAVFHDLGNLNFTFICHTENLDVSKHLKVIQSACKRAGIATEISGRNDILADGKKFSGNAFYNSKGRSYHHGTILINANLEKLSRYLTPPKAKLEAKGVKSVKSRVVNLSSLSSSLTCEDMKSHLLSAFEEIYNLKPVAFNEIENDCISGLANEYSSWEYLYGTPLPFNVLCEGRLSFGSVELQLYIDKGIITAVKFYTDSLNTELANAVETAIVCKTFDLASVSIALKNALSDIESNEIISLLESQAF